MHAAHAVQHRYNCVVRTRRGILKVREDLRFVQVYELRRCEIAASFQKLLKSPPGFRSHLPNSSVHEELSIDNHAEYFDLRISAQASV